LIGIGNFQWAAQSLAGLFQYTNLIALAILAFVFVEIVYYYIAIKNRKDKATYSEAFGCKLISIMVSVIMIATYQIILWALPVFAFVYGNYLWTNYVRRKQYEEEVN
jgi:uncharacterized membrane protein YoaK (UPF0700 family)